MPPIQATLYVRHPPIHSSNALIPPVGTQGNVFDNVPPTANQPSTGVFGISDATPPIPDQNDSNKILAPIGYNMDRLANPETSVKPGTIAILMRNEEIRAFVARFFNNYRLALRPGVTGRKLALGLKAWNDRPMPLYETLYMPFGRANRFCIWATALTWGARSCDPDSVVSEQDFISWAQIKSTPTNLQVIGTWGRRRARLRIFKLGE